MAKQKKRKSFKKRLLTVLAVLIVLLAVAVFFLPAIVAGPGRPIVVSVIGDGLAGSVQIDGLSLSWTGPQRISGLTLYDPDGEKVIDIASIDADVSLLAVAGGSRDFGTVIVNGIDGTIVQREDGSTNLQRAVASSPSSDTPSTGGGIASSEPIKCRIEWSDSQVSFDAPGIEPVRATKLTGHVQVDGLAQIDAAVEADLSQGDAAGSVDAKLSATDLFDATGAMQLDRARVEAESDINDLPVDVVDRLANMNGKLSALLGPKLDNRLSATYEGGQGSVNIVADSANLTQAAIDIAFNNDAITVGEQSKLTLRVTPQAWAALTATEDGAAPATLVEPFDVIVTIPSLRIARDGGKLRLADTAVQANVTVGDITLRTADERIGRVALRGTSLALSTEKLRESVSLTLDTKAEQNAHQGQAHVEATLSNIVDEQLAVTADRMQADVSGKVTELPLAVFDELLQQDGLIVATIGERLNADVEARLDPSEAGGTITLTAKAAHLDANVTGTVGADAIVLDEGGRITLMLQPAVVARFTEAASLLEPTSVRLTISKLNVPRGGEAMQVMDAAVDASVAFDSMRLRLPDRDAPLALGATTVQLQSAKLRDAVTLALNSAVNGGNASIDAQLKQPAYANGRASLAGGSTVSLDVAPAALAAFVPGEIQPASNLSADITIDRLDLPMDNLAAGRITMTGTMPQFTLTGDPKLAGMSLSDIAFNIGGEQTIGEALPIGLDAKLRRDGDEGQVQVRMQLAGAPDNAALTQAKVRLIRFPVAIADALANQDGKLIALLGQQMDVSLDATPQEADAMDFDAEVRAPQLEVTAAGRYSARQVQLNEGARIALTLTPQSFAALQPTSPWRLTQPATMNLLVDQLVAGLPQEESGIDYRELSVVGTLTSGELNLQREGETLTYRLRNMTADIDGKQFASQLTVDADATLVYPPGEDGQSTTGQITSTTTLNNLVNDAGALDFAAARFVTDTTIDRMPSDLVLTLAGQDPHLAEALGPNIEAAFQGSYPGDMALKITGENTSVSLVGHVDEQRTLTLREDAVMRLNVTPGLAQAYLAVLNPLLYDAKSSDEPVTLTLESDGFNLPLASYDPSAIAIDGRLAIGTLQMERGRFAGQLTAILRTLGSSIPNREQFEAKFTPLVFSVKDGVARSNDLWMQTEAWLLGAQARIHLPRTANEDAYAEVLFGIPGSTVRLIPETDRVDPATIYETATSGPLSEIKPDFKKMLTPIVARAAADAAGSPEASMAIGIVGELMRQRKGQQQEQGDDRVEGWRGATWPNRPAVPQTQQQQQQPSDQQQQQEQQQQQQQGGERQDALDFLF